MESIKKNYIYSVLYQILVIIIPLITAPYLSRIMGASNLGIYSYTNSVAYYFYLFSMLGISNYGNRTIAAVRDDRCSLNKIFSELLQMQVLFGGITFFFYVVYIYYLYKTQNSYFVPSMIWGIYVVSGIIDISWFFWGIEQFKITVIRNTVVKLLTTVGIFIFVRTESDLNRYIILIAGSSLISQGILWMQMKKYVSLIRIKFQNILKHIKSNIILFIPVLAVSIYTVMDKLMLGNLSEMQQLGYYDNVQKLMNLPTGLLTALGAVMLPRISNLLANGKRKIALNYIEMSMQFTYFFSIAFVFGLAGIGPTFSVVYFGEGFEPCGLMITLFSVTTFFIAWANVIRTQYLIPSGRDKIYIVSVFTGAFINVVVNLILIPRIEATGAIIGTIFAEATVALIQTVSVRKEIDIKKYWHDSILFIIPGIIMFFVVRFIGSMMGLTVISLITQVTCGAVVYFILAGCILFSSNTLLVEQIKQTINKITKKRIFII